MRVTSQSTWMRSGVAALGFLAVLPFTTALAAPLDEAISETVTATLQAEAEVVAPGDTVAIGLTQDIQAGWHTYWRNPGDSGLETVIDWRLPEGVEPGAIQWPAPERKKFGPLMNYGYSKHVTLLSDVTVPADWPEGIPFPVEAEARWLVCEEICIPEDAVFSFELPTGPETIPSPTATTLFELARAEHPIPSPWPVAAARTETGFALRVAAEGLDPARLSDAYLFPFQWGAVEHVAPQPAAVDPGGLTLTLTAGETAVTGPLEGVLVLTERSGGETLRTAFTVNAAPEDAAAWLASAQGTPITGGTLAAQAGGGGAGGASLPTILLFALLGGLILNLMPCVFPVLAMKGLGLVNKAHAAPSARMLGGIAYTGGVLLAFGLMAGALLGLKAGGTAVGWGFQLQQPLVVALLAYVLFAVGLNLSGVFQVGAGVMNVGGGLAAKDGPTGSFLTGILAAVVAAPCTAPFMATAVGAALLQPPPVAVAIFLTLGLGLALPYLLLTLSPALTRLLPKPGPWMERLKQALAFPMYASAAWLVWVLAQQVQPFDLLPALMGFVALALAAWIWNLAASRQSSSGRRIAQAAAAASLVAAIGLAAASDGLSPGNAEARAAARDQRAERVDGVGESFTQARLNALLAEGRPVFINMTASWCITCKVNERVALAGETFANALAENDVAYLLGDWTNQDPEITRLLESFGRAGVPLYVLYPGGGGEPILLPQLLTEGLVREAFQRI